MNTPSFEYENNILVGTFEDNFLLIASRGLCLERLFYKHLQLYSDSSVLVLVINAKRPDYDYFSKLLVDNGHNKPKYLTSETGTVERKSLYLEGGVQFVTTPILISDILCKRVPVQLVTGLLVFRAHTVLRSALESFILLTFKKEKCSAFVKAFSDAPHCFAETLGQLQRAITNLRVDHVHFLPRYHAEVVAELDSPSTSNKPDLVEVAVKLTPCMKSAQNCLMELIRACLQELKRSQIANVAAAENELTLESALLPWFEETCRRTFESKNFTWDSLPLKVKRLFDDISRLRQLLSCLEIDDGRSFAKTVSFIRNDPREHETNSGWLFTPTAENFFNVCQKRIEEVPAKWDALKDILNEIKMAKNKKSKILILAFEAIVCERVKHLIQPDKAGDADSWLPDGSLIELEFDADNINSKEEENGFFVYILPIFRRYDILLCLNYFRPNHIIFYNADIWSIRQIEIYNAVLPSISTPKAPVQGENSVGFLRIYLLMYETSAEEQRYLTSLQQERNSFEKLFKEETTLLLRKHDDTTKNLTSSAVLSEQFYLNSVDTSATDANVQQSIIVDMREFRSELPTLLHLRNIQLIPATLIVGDYILTSQICVERKSPQDLTGSLQSGRLFDQCRSMCRYYEKPLLLVELQQGRKGWRKFDDRQSAAKLATLAVTFPQIRIVWATNPSAAAEIFVHLKFKREEPDLKMALNCGKEDFPPDTSSSDGPICSSTKTLCNTTAERLLTALPGITTKNVSSIFKSSRCSNFRQFCQLADVDLSKIFGSMSVASSLATFISKDMRQVSKIGDTSTKPSSRVSRKRK